MCLSDTLNVPKLCLFELTSQSTQSEFADGIFGFIMNANVSLPNQLALRLPRH